MPPALIAGGTALAGGIAGAFGNKSNSSFTSGISLAPASGREINAGNAIDQSFGQLQGMVNAGPGLQDVTNSVDATRGFADLLNKASQQGGLDPTSDDYGRSDNLASALFGQQRVGLQQGFDEATRSSNAQAALMGRDPNDPVLRAKLMQNQMNQSAMLDASQNAFAMQNAAQRPLDRLNMASQRASVLGGLATQAMANRQAIAAMGQSIQNDERNFRINTGTRFGTQTQSSGGGVGGAISGALGGFGAGMSAMNSFSNMNLNNQIAQRFADGGQVPMYVGSSGGNMGSAPSFMPGRPSNGPQY